jgi:hypothetical protein
MSAYTAMIQHPRLSHAIDKQSDQATPPKTVRSKAPHKFADPALTPLLQRLQDVLGVDSRGEELRAILHHRSEHAFSLQIHERHAAYVHDAFAISIQAMWLFPIRFELRNPWPREPAFQGPSLFLGLVGNRDSQHCSLRSQSEIAHGVPFFDLEIKFLKVDGITGDETKIKSGRGKRASVPLPDSWHRAHFMAPGKL